MNRSIWILLKENVASWLRAKGLIIVLVAALVPAGLTGAWAFTHPLEIAVTDIDWDVEDPEDGDVVNITATIENRLKRETGGFDVLVRIGFFEEAREDEPLRLNTVNSETIRVEGLDPKQTTQVTMEWNARGGVFLVLVDADPEEELRERERLDNHRFRQIQVAHPEIRPQLPSPQEGDDNATEDGNETADLQAALRITDLGFLPENAFEGDSLTARFQVTNDGPDDVSNLTFVMQFFRISSTGQVQEVLDDQSRTFDLAQGDMDAFEMTVEDAARGHYAAQGFFIVPEGVEGTAPEEEVVARAFRVERQMLYEEPEADLTAKTFYQELVLDLIHLKILIPLIAVFFAAGVLNDERRKNTLPYLFTRPMPRWVLPITRFGVSFVVAGAAVAVGVLAVNAILLGQPGANVEYLLWPLGLTLGAVFVYGAVFILLGVMTDRPYLWGVIYVLGVELLIYVGRYILYFNDRPLFQSWAEFLSLNHWFLQVFAAWDPERVAPWFGTATTSAVVAGFGLAVIAVAALIGSSVAIKRKDFDV